MGVISNIVQVNIVRGTRTITRAGFGTPLIVGPNAAFQGVRDYGSVSDVLADFLTTDEEYIAATRLFTGSKKIRTIKIAGRTAEVAQVVTFTPNVSLQAIQSFKVTLNGVDFNFTSDANPTAAEVVTGLIALINAGTEPVTASGTTTLILTADSAGIGFTAVGTSNLSKVNTTPNNGIVEDLQDYTDADKDWYALVLTSRDEGEVLAAAGWIETQRKIFATSTDDADALDPVNTNSILSQLKALNYDRTFVFYSADEDAYPEAAMFAEILPLDPGSYTTAFKTMRGVVADNLTPTQYNAVLNKNGNTYTETAGLDIIENGTMVSGVFADEIRFVDWLQAQIEEEIFFIFANNAKVPYTDAGVAVIQGAILACLQRGIAIGGLADDPAPVVEVPKVAEVSPQDRAGRYLPDISFGANLAGAIHKLRIEGLVQV